MILPRAQEQHYASDRDQLLTRCRQAGRRFRVPAQTLPEVLQAEGFQITRRRNVPQSLFGFCDFHHREVVIAHNLAQRLTYPKSWRQVLHSTLAHELGHIRLHGAPPVDSEPDPAWETEADLYAQVFLVPRDELRQQPALAQLLTGRGEAQPQLWTYVLALATHFRVSGAFMARALHIYGFIGFDRSERILRPPALNRTVSHPVAP